MPTAGIELLGSANETLAAWTLNYELMGRRQPRGLRLGAGGVLIAFGTIHWPCR